MESIIIGLSLYCGINIEGVRTELLEVLEVLEMLEVFTLT